MEPGRILPRLVAPRYCDEVSMGAVTWATVESSQEEDHVILEGCPMTPPYFIEHIFPSPHIYNI